MKTNEKTNDWSDLLQLIGKINHSADDEFTPAAEKVLQTAHFIQIWAAINLFMNLHDYTGSANNFYLYRQRANNLFEWIICDVNLAFASRTDQDTLSIFYNPGRRPLITRMLKQKYYRDL